MLNMIFILNKRALR